VPLPVLWEEADRVHATWADLALGPLEFPRSEIAGAGEPPPTLTFIESGRAEVLSHIDAPPPPIAQRAEALTGKYRSHDLDADAEIFREGDDLWMNLRGGYSGPRRLRVRSWSDTAHEVAEPSHPAGALFAMTVERDADDASRRFRLDGPRVRHLAFARIDD
jgi:hypothetical protein